MFLHLEWVLWAEREGTNNAGVPAITSIERVSTPGRRIYAGYSSVPKVIGGMGVSILTTSRGVMTDAEARRQKVGGELLAKVW